MSIRESTPNYMNQKKRKIVMAFPYVSPGMIGEVVDTLKSRWIGEGPKVVRFERMFEQKFGIPEGHAVAVNSGTSALELAYDLIGLTKNDEVATTPLTCTATNIPLVRRGCHLSLYDISRDSLCFSEQSLPKGDKRRDGLRGLVVVNLAGIKADIPDVDCPVVVDACQSLGIWDDKADYTCYSFQAIKHITTGDGGMLVCKDKAKAEEARLRRWFGIDRRLKLTNNWQPYKNRKILFDIDYPGYKMQMTDIAAALGIGALREWDEILAHRKKIFTMYKDAIKGMKGITMVDGKENTYWLAGMLVENRDSFCDCLNKAGIETNVMHVRNDVYRIFEPFKTKLPNMDWVDERYIYIPLHNRMSIDDAAYIIKQIRKFNYEDCLGGVGKTRRVGAGVSFKL
jgi:perosamine synthetase